MTPIKSFSFQPLTGLTLTKFSSLQDGLEQPASGLSPNPVMLGEMGRTANQVVVFFTHLFDNEIGCRFEKLKSDIGGIAELFILSQAGSSIPDRYLDRTHFFDYDGLRSAAKEVIGEQLLPGNVHLVALDFFRNHPGFDYYWFIEYDVVFSGSWMTLFRAVQNDGADLLAAHIRGVADEPRWPWWETLDLPGCPLPQSEWIRAFFPVYRISSEGLQAIDKHVKLGWTGHFEGLVPCAIRSESLSISDLGGAGSWTPKERRHRFYSSFSWDNGGTLTAGTLRHRPPQGRLRLRRDTIFHPVKAVSSNRAGGAVQYAKRLYHLSIRCLVSLRYNSLFFWTALRDKETR